MKIFVQSRQNFTTSCQNIFVIQSTLPVFKSIYLIYWPGHAPVEPQKGKSPRQTEERKLWRDELDAYKIWVELDLDRNMRRDQEEAFALPRATEKK